MDMIQNTMRQLSLGQDAAGARPMTTLDSLKEDLLKEQNNAALSAKQKGQKPHHRIPRMVLLFNHYQLMDAQREAKIGEGRIWFPRTLVTNEYRPSNRNFIDLKPITVKDLFVETVHSDYYIVLRCVYRRRRLNNG